MPIIDLCHSCGRATVAWSVTFTEIKSDWVSRSWFIWELRDETGRGWMQRQRGMPPNQSLEKVFDEKKMRWNEVEKEILWRELSPTEHGSLAAEITRAVFRQIDVCHIHYACNQIQLYSSSHIFNASVLRISVTYQIMLLDFFVHTSVHLTYSDIWHFKCQFHFDIKTTTRWQKEIVTILHMLR